MRDEATRRSIETRRRGERTQSPHLPPDLASGLAAAPIANQATGIASRRNLHTTAAPNRFLRAPVRSQRRWGPAVAAASPAAGVRPPCLVLQPGVRKEGPPAWQPAAGGLYLVCIWAYASPRPCPFFTQPKHLCMACLRPGGRGPVQDHRSGPQAGHTSSLQERGGRQAVSRQPAGRRILKPTVAQHRAGRITPTPPAALYHSPTSPLPRALAPARALASGR